MPYTPRSVLSYEELIIQSAMVRSYAPYDKTKAPGKRVTAKERKERQSNEWDVRIDVTPAYADEIQANLEKAKEMIDYCLVSGIEKADSEVLTTGSKENHIHIAIIFKYALRKDQVLATCRGLIRKTDEYCVPRNKKFTYAGWYIHHTKIDWKLVLEPTVRLEFGVLPQDDDNEYNRTSILRLFKKFGMDDTVHSDLLKIRFATFLNN